MRGTTGHRSSGAGPDGERQRLARRLGEMAGELAAVSELLRAGGAARRAAAPSGSSDYPVPEAAASDVREPAAATAVAELSGPPLGAGALLGLVEVLTPDLRVPGAAAVAQARRNALARAELAHEFGLLDSAEVAELAGSNAKNRAALANRWTKEGRIFALPHAGRQLWPGFQFDAAGRPRAAVAEVLAILGEELSPWSLALWFTGRTGWLDGRRPVDLLESEPGAVVEAARSEGEQPAF